MLVHQVYGFLFVLVCLGRFASWVIYRFLIPSFLILVFLILLLDLIRLHEFVVPGVLLGRFLSLVFDVLVFLLLLVALLLFLGIPLLLLLFLEFLGLLFLLEVHHCEISWHLVVLLGQGILLFLCVSGVQVLVVFLLYPDIQVLKELLIAFGLVLFLHYLLQELLPEWVDWFPCTLLPLAWPLRVLLPLAEVLLFLHLLVVD